MLCSVKPPGTRGPRRGHSACLSASESASPALNDLLCLWGSVKISMRFSRHISLEMLQTQRAVPWGTGPVPGKRRRFHSSQHRRRPKPGSPQRGRSRVEVFAGNQGLPSSLFSPGLSARLVTWFAGDADHGEPTCALAPSLTGPHFRGSPGV